MSRWLAFKKSGTFRGEAGIEDVNVANGDTVVGDAKNGFEERKVVWIWNYVYAAGNREVVVSSCSLYIGTAGLKYRIYGQPVMSFAPLIIDMGVQP